MSVMFSVDGVSVWWPAATVGQLFKEQAEAIARAFGTQSGLGELYADEVIIDLPLFEVFLMRLAEQYRTPYYVVKSLVEGVFWTSYVMVERAGGQLPEMDPQTPGWDEIRFQFSRSMPT